MDALYTRGLAKKQKSCNDAGNGIPPHMKTSKEGYLYCSLVSYEDALDIEEFWKRGGCGCMDSENKIAEKGRFHPACFYVTEKPIPNGNEKKNSD